MVIQIAAVAALAIANLTGCTDGQQQARFTPRENKEAPVSRPGAPEPAATRSDLPFGHGRSFSSLGDYLAHLRLRAGPIGQPWYREIRPGVYEVVTTMAPRRETEIHTRAQLMERFGFTR